MIRVSLHAVCAFALLLGWACQTSREPAEASAPASHGAAAAPLAPHWPGEFLERQVLTAREVRIVGPVGLLAHLAIVHDSEHHEHVEKTTERGLTIEERLKAGAEFVPIQAQLDNLVIAVDARLSVLESPQLEQVVVEAEGDVYWCHLPSRREQRAESLRLEGSKRP